VNLSISSGAGHWASRRSACGLPWTGRNDKRKQSADPTSGLSSSNQLSRMLLYKHLSKHTVKPGSIWLRMIQSEPEADPRTTFIPAVKDGVEINSSAASRWIGKKESPPHTLMHTLHRLFILSHLYTRNWLNRYIVFKIWKAK